MFRDTGVLIWTSANDLAEEYLRGCKINFRSDSSWYRRCDDFVHTGFVAVYNASQILLNHLCNRFVLRNELDPTSSHLCCD